MRRLNEVPPAIAALAADQEGLVSVRQCNASGLDRRRVRRLVERGIWRREGDRLLDTDPVPPSARQRDDYFDHIRRRSAVKGLLICPGSAAVGAAALTLHGVAGLPRHIEPEVSFARGVHHRGTADVVVRQYGNFRTVRFGAWRIANLEHAVAQALPLLPRDDAVAVVSNVLSTRRIDTAGLAEVRRLLHGRRAAAGPLSWLDLADGRDESPAETRARLSCVDNGVPPHRVQVVFRKNGQFLGRCDFGWQLRDGRWLVVEIDGLGPHSTAEALVRDAPRQNRLLATGRIVLLRFKPSDNDEPGGVGARVAAHLDQLGGPAPAPPASQVSPASPVDL